jgi:transcription antitermination factor NusG
MLHAQIQSGDCGLNSGESWFAIWTKPRHEKAVSSQLGRLGFSTFAPMVEHVHRWTDRRKKIEMPLFPRYTFVKLQPTLQERVRILRLYGVNGFVGSRGQGTPIPEKQIADLKTLLDNDVDFSLIPALKVGQRVRIRGGCLEGIEGTLAAKSNETLVISIEPIEHSVSIRIDGFHVDPI